jgi:hypothetical protein
MGIRWRWILPAVGLLLFFGETQASVRMNREFAHGRTHSRYFWWGSFRLDSEPRLDPTLGQCRDNTEPCVNWELSITHVDPGYLVIAQLVGAFPAFFVGVRIVHALASAGANEVVTFFVLLPCLILARYYFLGWLLDLRKYKRKLRLSVAS